MRPLLMIDSSGNLVLADVENGARIAVGPSLASPDGAEVTTAVWSEEGQWTAWSVESDRGEGVRQLRIHDEATDSWHVLADALPAFYLSPSPCGRFLSHLSPGPLGLELAVSEIATGDLRIIERGQPMFWAWSPDSRHLAVHVETRVVVSAVDGSVARVLSDDADPFIAPWWLPGPMVAFAQGGRIVSCGLDQAFQPATGLSEPLPLLELSTVVADGGAGRFAIGPDGRRVALIDREGEQPILFVHDVLSSARTEITGEQTLGFFWSPDGLRLAALVVASPTEVRWLVFDGAETVALRPFRPGMVWLRSVLPFFEQYAHSHAVWSADSIDLVAPAIDATGGAGALVQQADGSGVEAHLTNAELAWWA